MLIAERVAAEILPFEIFASSNTAFGSGLESTKILDSGNSSRAWAASTPPEVSKIVTAIQFLSENRK
jgi:hypothetical protein